MPLREWPAVVACAAVALVVEVGLSAVKLPALSRRLGVTLEYGEPVPPAPGTYLRLPPWALLRMRAAARVMRHWPFGDSCLRSALLTGQRLRRLQPILRVGVAKDGTVIRAHAWIEISGVSLDPSAPSVFSVLQPVQEKA
ncbi:MAG: lasso peptide biosynthesis B2 protein [Acidothermaceae bacterium]